MCFQWKTRKFHQIYWKRGKQHEFSMVRDVFAEDNNEYVNEQKKLREIIENWTLEKTIFVAMLPVYTNFRKVVVKRSNGVSLSIPTTHYAPVTI